MNIFVYTRCNDQDKGFGYVGRGCRRAPHLPETRLPSSALRKTITLFQKMVIRQIDSFYICEANNPASPGAGEDRRHPCRATMCRQSTTHHGGLAGGIASGRGPTSGQTKLKAAGQPLLPPKDSHHVSTLSGSGGIHQAPVRRQVRRCHRGEHYADAVGRGGSTPLRSCSPSCRRCPMTDGTME
ncbi:hypothetical protein EJB05_09974, partial [Eragrostis curvula]